MQRLMQLKKKKIKLKILIILPAILAASAVCYYFYRNFVYRASVKQAINSEMTVAVPQEPLLPEEVREEILTGEEKESECKMQWLTSAIGSIKQQKPITTSGLKECYEKFYSK